MNPIKDDNDSSFAMNNELTHNKINSTLGLKDDGNVDIRNADVISEIWPTTSDTKGLIINITIHQGVFISGLLMTQCLLTPILVELNIPTMHIQLSQAVMNISSLLMCSVHLCGLKPCEKFNWDCFIYGIIVIVGIMILWDISLTTLYIHMGISGLKVGYWIHSGGLISLTLNSVDPIWYNKIQVMVFSLTSICPLVAYAINGISFRALMLVSSLTMMINIGHSYIFSIEFKKDKVNKGFNTPLVIMILIKGMNDSFGIFYIYKLISLSDGLLTISLVNMAISIIVTISLTLIGIPLLKRGDRMVMMCILIMAIFGVTHSTSLSQFLPLILIYKIIEAIMCRDWSQVLNNLRRKNECDVFTYNCMYEMIISIGRGLGFTFSIPVIELIQPEELALMSGAPFILYEIFGAIYDLTINQDEIPAVNRRSLGFMIRKSKLQSEGKSNGFINQ